MRSEGNGEHDSPPWVSEVLRAFAWWIILVFKGPLNALLLVLGLIEGPIRWTNIGHDGVVVGLIYTFGLFMLFPICNAIQSLEPTRPRRPKIRACRRGRFTGAS